MEPAALMPALQLAVPLRIHEAHQKSPGLRANILRAWRVNAVEPVAGRGDQLMFLSKPHKGEGGTADTFNHLARGLAALAFQPGGVRFNGTLWCAEHAPWGASAADGIACRHCGDGQPAGPRQRRGVEVVELPPGDVTP